MKPEEIRACLKRLNMAAQQLARLLGLKNLNNIDQEKARVIRALVLIPSFKAIVDEMRECFPQAIINSVRNVDA